MEHADLVKAMDNLGYDVVSIVSKSMTIPSFRKYRIIQAYCKGLISAKEAVDLSMQEYTEE